MGERGAGGQEAETVTSAPAGGPGESPLALYVTGPGGGTRHLLPPSGLVRLGRAAESTIVLHDRRVSRLHAAVDLGPAMTLIDLGSANGTFVGRVRVGSGEARPLELGETFFVGDSALALRASGLVTPPPERFIPAAALAGRLDEARGLALMKAAAARADQRPWVEAVLADLLAAPTDWMARLGRGDVAAGVRAGAAADARSLERAAIERLASWGIAATLESVFLSREDPAAAQRGLAFLRGDGNVRLQRGTIVVRDAAMEGVMRTLSRVAPAPVSVLLLGETGVGKDVMASLVHERSPRADKPMVRLNCAALPEPLLESELFGHERGAFTGATAAKPGLLEVADGGTVFLDEIGDLALSLQAKLLRAVESSQVTRVGGLRPVVVDVRFVSATSRDLEADVQTGRFRRDLYHRINTVTVTVPPLRRRPADIEPLARVFLDGACARFSLSQASFSPQAVAALEAHAWPGNVRELRNVVERAVLLAAGPVLEPRDLGLAPAQAEPAPAGVASAAGARGPAPRPNDAGNGDERARIVEALQRCGGNQSRAAALLGMPRRTLVRKIVTLRLPRPRPRSREPA